MGYFFYLSIMIVNTKVLCFRTNENAEMLEDLGIKADFETEEYYADFAFLIQAVDYIERDLEREEHTIVMLQSGSSVHVPIKYETMLELWSNFDDLAFKENEQ